MLPPYAKLTKLAITSPELLSLDEAKLNCRVDPGDTTDDSNFPDWIKAARRVCEGYANSTFVTTPYRLTLDHLPYLGINPIFGYWETEGNRCYQDHAIELPMPPLVAVQSITYLDLAGDTVTLDPSSYVVSAGSPGRISPAYGMYFPFTRSQIAAVNINYTAGMNPDDVWVVKQAMRILVVNQYDDRLGDCELPPFVKCLLNPVVFHGYG
jgi:hypothetical protein